MAYELPAPDDAVLRPLVSLRLPHLAAEALEPLGAGWAFWAFRAGDTVLRFPRDPEYAEGLAAEAAVMREIAPSVPLPVSAIEVHEDGPNGLPFTSHAFVDGLPIAELQRPLAASAGAKLGRFLHALHAFPAGRAAALGLAVQTPDLRRAAIQRLLDRRIRPEAFPMIDEDARQHIVRTFSAFLDEPANFRWQPALCHGDIDARNVLASPDSGEVTGVIDWGDLTIGDPAFDFTSAQYGSLGRAGLREQLPSVWDACGLPPDEQAAMTPRCRFIAYCEPLHHILYGIESRQEAVVRQGLDALPAAIAAYDAGDPGKTG